MVRRIKQFSKGGASRIDLVELPSEMTKLEALTYLSFHADFQSPADQATIADSIADKSKGTSEVKVKASKTKPSLDAIKARAKKSKEVSVEDILAAVEDAPL
jgi:hypothetical protein